MKRFIILVFFGVLIFASVYVLETVLNVATAFEWDLVRSRLAVVIERIEEFVKLPPVIKFDSEARDDINY